ncbi:hypothetical protein FS837_007648 [Tulasnella sp. UAMH 9824]|nr:hypothetical protein FS837_007648 [Tulasnella sp. UAMH 9824]
MLMTAQSIDQARQRYSQELARHTKMQWHLAQSEAAQRRQQEEAAGANSKAGSVSSNGRGSQPQRSTAGSQDARGHEPTALPPSSATQPDPPSSLKEIVPHLAS